MANKLANVHEIARSVLDGVNLSDTDRELLEHRIKEQIRAAERRVLRRREIRTHEGQITPLQEDYLLLIEQVGGGTLKYVHVCKYGEDDKWTTKTQAAVDRLCALGYLEISRVRIADGRPARFYKINDAGRNQLDVIKAVRAAFAGEV